MSGFSVTRGRPGRLGRRAHKSVLLVHIVSAGMWFGLDVALAVLAFTALLTGDPHLAATCLEALRLFAVWPMLVAALACLGSGIVLGLGTRYGLLRYWWVAGKLAINIGMCLLILFALRPGLGEAAAHGARLAAGEPVGALPRTVVFAPIVSPTLLLIAYLLSVFKPWGRVRRRTAGTRRGTRVVAGA